jgi:hypothetical protein
MTHDVLRFYMIALEPNVDGSSGSPHDPTVVSEARSTKDSVDQLLVSKVFLTDVVRRHVPLSAMATSV